MFNIFKNEAFFCGTVEPRADFYAEVKELILKALTEAPANYTPVWFRFHLSDIANQEDILRKALADTDCRCAVAIVGQAPLCGAHAGLEAYFFRGKVSYPEKDMTAVEDDSYTHLYFNTRELTTRGSGPQMNEEFLAAEKIISSRGGNIPENLQRTWIYCRDIDNNYADLVTARKNLFTQWGMTADTHYITSTGIEGSSHPHYRLVRMDSMALFGHDSGQIQYLYAPEHLSPTHIYGVTFERGTRIIYGDRSCYYISGTASIDKEGKVVHLQDVEKQTLRLLENVDALMKEGGGSLNDLVQAVIYLRDPADYDRVKKIIDSALPASATRLIVRGSICRPTWLVEMDAIGINANGDPQFAARNQ